MRKTITFMLLITVMFNLCACGGDTGKGEETMTYIATDADIAHLESLYAGRQAVHGDMHNHSASTPESDGKNTLKEWKENMAYLTDLDFATIVDHEQVKHMRLEDWDETVFVGGSEPGLVVTDCSNCTSEKMDYAMVFAKPEGLEAVLNTYIEDYLYLPEISYRWEGKIRGDHQAIAELAGCVRDNGGLFVQVHPTLDGYFDPVDPLDYWFCDEVGFEVINGLKQNLKNEVNFKAYETWVTLLKNGKRIWATAGGDTHKLPNVESIVTLYSTEKNATGYISQMRVGDLTAGPVGIRMSIGDAVTGGVGSFEGNRVVVAVGDFHSVATKPNHTYRLDLYDDTGLIISQEISTTEVNYIAIDADPARNFYRANVYDVTDDYIFAVGNPIWNEAGE